MSILIKGMEMPASGVYEISVDNTNGRDKTVMTVYKRKDNGFLHIFGSYELVPVPPHRRLIDADALKKRIAATYYSQDEKDKAPIDDIPWMNGCNTKVKEVCGMIDDAPTIIEAEPTQSNASNVLGALTNADRIRAMTDEELAVWLSDMHDSVTCPNNG